MATHYDGSASTVSTEQYFIPEIWADGIYKYFERKTVFRGLVDDYSSLVKGKGYGDAINAVSYTHLTLPTILRV